jgi:hypothetical protein
MRVSDVLAKEMNQAKIQVPYSYSSVTWRRIMDQNKTNPQVAQPAKEELKNHGDQLAKQVRDAAGKLPENSPAEATKETPKE